ncbi:MAG: glycosyltransferase family 2 protein [Weeksellaceae bacterium]|nr:glycosyltransferase family 2 protein [Weeksellaceae bacterium]
MRIAVAILNWNGAELLKTFLPAVLEHSRAAEVYVIDNASDDGSVELLRHDFPTVKLIEHAENLGFTGGYNQAMSQIDAEVVCLLNSDVEVTAGWLDKVQQVFADEKVAAMQPKILDYYKRNFFEYAGAGGGMMDNFGYPYCRGRVFWTLEEDLEQYDDTLEVFWASGACMFVRKEYFLAMGGFEERFFAHMEEIDLCWRWKNKGFKIIYCGAAKVYHMGGATIPVKSPHKTFLNFRNNLWMLLRNLPKRKVLPVIFQRLVLDGIAAVVFLRYEGVAHFTAIVRAHFAFYAGAGYFWKSRQRTVYRFYKHRFVPWQYFILQKKYFRKLY